MYREFFGALKNPPIVVEKIPPVLPCSFFGLTKERKNAEVALLQQRLTSS
jgi:hypothetical protein